MVRAHPATPESEPHQEEVMAMSNRDEREGREDVEARKAAAARRAGDNHGIGLGGDGPSAADVASGLVDEPDSQRGERSRSAGHGRE